MLVFRLTGLVSDERSRQLQQTTRLLRWFAGSQRGFPLTDPQYLTKHPRLAVSAA